MVGCGFLEEIRNNGARLWVLGILTSQRGRFQKKSEILFGTPVAGFFERLRLPRELACTYFKTNDSIFFN